MAVADFDQQYAGYGIPSIGPVDSGVVASTTTPKTVTLTVPANADATQPTVKRGKLVIVISGANGAMVLGQIDVSVSDGTTTICVGSIPAAVAATAGRGGTFVMDIFSALVDITTIKTIVVVIATTASNVYNVQTRFLGERD